LLGLGITDAFDQRLLIEIQAGKIARVGVVFQAQINAVGAVVHGSLQRRQTAGRTNQFKQRGRREDFK
jgi:hypothetical protein